MSREEFIALGEIAEARQQLLINVFAGTKLEFGAVSAAGTSVSLLKSGVSVGSSAKKLAAAGVATSTWKACWAATC